MTIVNCAVSQANPNPRTNKSINHSLVALQRARARKRAEKSGESDKIKSDKRQIAANRVWK
jgi:hypothetical protein